MKLMFTTNPALALLSIPLAFQVVISKSNHDSSGSSGLIMAMKEIYPRGLTRHSRPPHTKISPHPKLLTDEDAIEKKR